MRRVPLTSRTLSGRVPGDRAVNPASVLSAIVTSGGTQGLSLEEMRRAMRVADALAAAAGSDRVLLEDADWAYLCDRLKGHRFGVADAALVAMVDDDDRLITEQALAGSLAKSLAPMEKKGVRIRFHSNIERIARAAVRGPLAPRCLGEPAAPYAHALAMISIAGVATYSFNPILLQPPMAFLLWTCLGLLLGAALAQHAGGLGSDGLAMSAPASRKARTKTRA